MENLTIDNIRNIMDKLSKERPVFHLEADFQYALAWMLGERVGPKNIRLEKGVGGDQYIDIVVNKEIFIELKYKTRKLTKNENYRVNVKGEDFYLIDQNAQDNARYDFWKDVDRVRTKSEKGGYAIFLTNDHLYWESNCRGHSAEEFAINDGREMHNVKKMEWNFKKLKVSKKERTKGIAVDLQRTLKWEPYGTPIKDGCVNAVFQYLALDIPHKKNV